jgi:hypothetical protein
VVLVAAAEQSTDPEQRVAGVPAVAEGLLLHPAADLVDRVQTKSDDVERIRHSGGLRQAGPQAVA